VETAGGGEAPSLSGSIKDLIEGNRCCESLMNAVNLGRSKMTCDDLSFSLRSLYSGPSEFDRFDPPIEIEQHDATGPRYFRGVR